MGVGRRAGPDLVLTVRVGRARGGARRLLLTIAVAVGAAGAVTAASVSLAAGSQRGTPASALHAGTASISPPSDESRQERSREEKSPDDEPSSPIRPAVVSTRHTAVGSVLVGDSGLTIYLFSADSRGVSSCPAACTRSWSPVRSHGGKPRGSALVPSEMIGSIVRKDGSYQVTLDGQPLYHYVGDRNPGDAKGQGLVEFGGRWQAARPRGKP